MGYKKFIKIRPIVALLVVLLTLTITSKPAAAMQHAMASEKAYVKYSTIIQDDPSVAAAGADDAALTADGTGEEVDHTDLYKSVGYYTMILILVGIFIGIIGKVLKVYELTREMQGRNGNINWNKIQGFLLILALVGALYGTYWSYSYWGYVLGISASEHGENIDTMMIVTIIITTIVFVITQILLFGFSFKYSGSNERKAYYYPHNNAIERIWTFIPAIVLTVLVIFGFTTWRSITNVSEEDQKKAINVEVTGEQFKWSIRYAGEDNELGLKNYKLINPDNGLGIDFTDRKSWDDKLGGEIVLPVNRPVRFTINSKDILHSFYMPNFRVQINAVPGMPTYFQFTPRYTTAEYREKINDATFEYILLCNKICGAGHYNMKTVVKIVSESEYKDWLAKQSLFYNDDVKKQLQMAAAAKSSENNLALNK